MENKLTRINKIKDNALDTATDTTIEWLNDYIKKNLPKLLTWSKNEIKNKLILFFEKKEPKIYIKNAIYDAIKIGEENKERALIKAMKESGVPEIEIKKIINVSKKISCYNRENK